MDSTVIDPSTSSSDDAAPEPTPTGAAAAPTGASARVPWIVAGVLGIVAIVMTALWIGASQTDEPEVRGAALAFMTELTTWDASEGLEDTTDALRAMGTGDFLDEVDEVLGSEVRATAEALGVVSLGEVTEIIVDGNVAIVFVEQTLTVGDVTQAQEQIARLVLVEVEGDWKVERVELLNAPVPLEGEAP